MTMTPSPNTNGEAGRRPSTHFLAPVNLLGPRGIAVIIQFAAAKHGMRPADITGPARDALTFEARREVIRLAFTHTRMTYSQIGRALHRDHSTILYSLGRTSQTRFQRVDRPAELWTHRELPRRVIAKIPENLSKMTSYCLPAAKDGQM